MCSALPFTLRHLPHAFGEYLQNHECKSRLRIHLWNQSTDGWPRFYYGTVVENFLVRVVQEDDALPFLVEEAIEGRVDLIQIAHRRVTRFLSHHKDRMPSQR
jgi:hypothetical protein